MATLLNPCWKSSPPICQKTWLPSLKDLPDLMLWISRGGSLCEVKRIWQCTGENSCGGWHADLEYKGPSGGTSGTTRASKHADDPTICKPNT